MEKLGTQQTEPVLRNCPKSNATQRAMPCNVWKIVWKRVFTRSWLRQWVCIYMHRVGNAQPWSPTSACAAEPRRPEPAAAGTPCCLRLKLVMWRVGWVMLRRVVRRVWLGPTDHNHLPRHELLLRRHHGGLLACRGRPQAHL